MQLIKTKKCAATGDLMLQVGGNTLHSLQRKKDRLGVFYKSDRFSSDYKTITEAKQKTLVMIEDGVFGQHIKDLIAK